MSDSCPVHGVRLPACIRVVAAATSLLLVAAPARAQSAINGTVRDSSGAVLPGVTVVAASPALIEGKKEAVTDGSGQYLVTDLRPGTYTVTFTLAGFAKVERRDFRLLSEFNARLDAEMQVGAVQETITVGGQPPPIVDARAAEHVVVLDREAIDNIPSGRTNAALAGLILGVQVSATDVGGSGLGSGGRMSLRGGAVGGENNNYMVDGMIINGMQVNGRPDSYQNHANFQEMTYQTSSTGAEYSGGGISWNLIPREGGNRFSGTGGISYRPGALQAENYSERMEIWGFQEDRLGNPAINRIDQITDFTITQGGPILRDKLWFFVSGRDARTNNFTPNAFWDDGTQASNPITIGQMNVRLTYQMSPRNKIGAFYERIHLLRDRFGISGTADPETATARFLSRNMSNSGAKYTGVITSRLVAEASFSQNMGFYKYDPRTEKLRGTPEWYATASHNATGGGLSVAPTITAARLTEWPAALMSGASLSYVAGRHTVKTGVTLRWGKSISERDANADLAQNYPIAVRDGLASSNFIYPTTTLYDQDRALFARVFPQFTNGSPCNPNTGTTTCTVTITNTPLRNEQRLNMDMGLYVQDSFRYKRLTANGGIRFETVKSQIVGQTLPAGRFVPAREWADRTGLPDWRDWAPRLQLAYDVFGDSRTAVKYSINRYNQPQTTGVAGGLDPGGQVTTTRDWTDLNRDNIAQGQRTFAPDGRPIDCVYLTPGCEINLSGTASQPALSPTFGGIGEPGVYNGAPRQYRIEQSFEVQHALLPRLSLTSAYYHGDFKNQLLTVNRARIDDGTQGIQYRPVTLYNPIDGTPFTYYNAIVTLPTDNVTYVEPLRKRAYDTVMFEMQLRPHAGAQLTGGIELTRTLDKNCGSSLIKPDGTPALVDPNSRRFCDEWNLVTFDGGPAITKPFMKNFKLSGAFPLAWGVNAGVSWQNIDGPIPVGTLTNSLSPTFRYGTAFRYPTGQTDNILGNSAAFPACPTAYGCVPGGPTVPANWVGAAGGTVIALEPTGRISDERLVQLDFQVSKTFRFGGTTVRPTFEVFNVLNADNVQGRTSEEVINAAGTYMQPSSMLQGRIIGFSVNREW